MLTVLGPFTDLQHVHGDFLSQTGAPLQGISLRFSDQPQPIGATVGGANWLPETWVQVPPLSSGQQHFDQDTPGAPQTTWCNVMALYDTSLSPDAQPYSMTFDLSVTATPQPTPFVAPPPPPAPSDMPPAPACPPANTLQDLADQLCQLGTLLQVVNGKLDYLAQQTTPPTSTPDDQPTPAPAGIPVAKPAGAIGVVIELTSLPLGTAEYGSPGYIPNKAWALMMTDNGPLPSIMVRHNPLVLFFPNPQVTSVTLDLEPGVVGQVRFLQGPK